MIEDLPPAVPAIVIGLGSTVGLQTARVLHDLGIPVIGITNDPRHFAARTNACRRVYQADIHNGGFLALLDRLRPEFASGAVLFPCTDQSALLVSRYRHELAPAYLTGLADHATMVMLADKTEFARLAERLQLHTPHTEVLSRRHDAERAAATMTFPALLKPALKTARWKQGTTTKVSVVESPDQFLTAYDDLAPWAETMVLQQFIPGGDDQLYTCNAYFDREHRLRAAFVSRKVRQWPPRVGTASLAQPAHNEEVVDLATRLFQAAHFTGLAYLELKYDTRTDQYVLIEANVGRPTGRSAMSEAAGVPLLATMYADVLDRSLPANREQNHSHVHWVDDRRDLLAAVRLCGRGELTVAQWRRSLRGPRVHAVASARDPIPFALELAQSLQTALRRRGGADRRRSVGPGHVSAADTRADVGTLTSTRR